MSDETAYFLQQNTSLGAVADGDDLLHPVPDHLAGDPSITETQYFGFSAPDAGIHGFCYLWHHPTLGLVSGGLGVHRGDKYSMTFSELHDFRTYMNDDALAGDLHKYRLDNGYGVEILEPLKRHRITYEDARRGNKVDLEFEAFIPPVMFGDGAHFDQPGRISGNLTLRGQDYAIDCLTMRDRSWSKPRPEESMPLPAVSWMQGVFDESFSFCATMLDHQSGAELAGTALAMPDEKTLSGGWLLRDGRLGRLVAGTKKVRRDRDGRPLEIRLELTDEYDRSLDVHGTPATAMSYNMWGNIFMWISLMRWECEGRVAHGDCQDGLWNDHLMALQR